jgi:hypothetical protein
VVGCPECRKCCCKYRKWLKTCWIIFNISEEDPSNYFLSPYANEKAYWHFGSHIVHLSHTTFFFDK